MREPCCLAAATIGGSIARYIYPRTPNENTLTVEPWAGARRLVWCQSANLREPRVLCAAEPETAPKQNLRYKHGDIALILSVQKSYCSPPTGNTRLPASSPEGIEAGMQSLRRSSTCRSNASRRQRSMRWREQQQSFRSLLVYDLGQCEGRPLQVLDGVNVVLNHLRASTAYVRPTKGR
jgi:hypothetical protein